VEFFDSVNVFYPSLFMHPLHFASASPLPVSLLSSWFSESVIPILRQATTNISIGIATASPPHLYLRQATTNISVIFAGAHNMLVPGKGFHEAASIAYQTRPHASKMNGNFVWFTGNICSCMNPTRHGKYKSKLSHRGTGTT
jgi:hypothetical protein